MPYLGFSESEPQPKPGAGRLNILVSCLGIFSWDFLEANKLAALLLVSTVKPVVPALTWAVHAGFDIRWDYGPLR